MTPWLGLAPVAILLASLVRPPARRRAVVGAGVLAWGLVVAVLVVDGWRWEVAALLGATALAGVVAGLRGRDRQRPRGLARAAGVVTVLAALGLAVVGAGLAWAMPPVRLTPDGPAAVGTVTIEWTTDRDEPADPGHPRVLDARLWYPTNRAPTGSVPYLGRTDAESRAVARGIAAQFGLPAFLLEQLADGRVTASEGAPPVPGPLPVVLFSPGYGGGRYQNTQYALDLAARGYLVLALDHPYDGALTVRADGTEVPDTSRSGGIDVPGLVARRAADLRSALDHLLATNGTDLAPGVRLDLDPARVAVAGHSLGGAAAALAAVDDPRIAAAVNIDGFPSGIAPGAAAPPILSLVRDGAHAGYTQALRRLAAASSAGWVLQVPGTRHITYTDSPAFLPPVPAVVGSLGRAGATPQLTTATLAFLGAVLTPGAGRAGPADSAPVTAVLGGFGDLLATPSG